MQTLHSADDFQSGGRKVSLAIGMFDGVHLGHQQVIRQARADAEQHEGIAVAVTFDRHPNSIVAPDRVPPLIYAPSQKLRAIASLGMNATLVVPFTREFSEQPADVFIRALAAKLAPLQSICVGSSFVFGHRRSGNVALLQQLGRELHFIVHGIAAVSLDGEIVSSTRIRDTLRTGNLDSVSQMLGREYALCGTVSRGDELGRTLGFPTANLEVAGLLVPPHGVYVAHAYVDGTRHRAVVNIGVRPTLRQTAPELRVEAHLLDFDGDLYDRELELIFVEKLRDERKFSSTDELREQIARDIAAARTKF
ncbi:MAG TPA: bifunctional riboflavin kinase/FAD synthetase [Verrucomicrobiae bacterium]|jgi:riboflavin kinase/FMN adenylyltransferase